MVNGRVVLMVVMMGCGKAIMLGVNKMGMKLNKFVSLCFH